MMDYLHEDDAKRIRGGGMHYHWVGIQRKKIFISKPYRNVHKDSHLHLQEKNIEYKRMQKMET